MFGIINWFLTLIGAVGKSNETADVNFQKINPAKIAVKDATLILLTKRPDHVDEVQAAVAEITALMDSGVPASIDDLEAKAREKVMASDLSDIDKIAALSMVSLVRMEIEKQLKKANLGTPAQQYPEIKTILGWVSEAAGEAGTFSKKKKSNPK